MQPENKFTSIQYVSSYITIHRHVSVASAVIIRASHKNTNNTAINEQNTRLKPPYVTVNIFSAPVVMKCQIMLPLKTGKNGRVYVAS